MIAAEFRYRRLSKAGFLLCVLALVGCGGGGERSPLQMTEVNPTTMSQSGAEGYVAAQVELKVGTDDVSSSPVKALAATAPLSANGGNIYYVDNHRGSDSNDGKSLTPGTGGRGPWQSLWRVTVAPLKPGDTIRLVCGGGWNETLKINKAGTASAPITVASYPENCTNPAAIDGSTYISAKNWVQFKGNVYKTNLQVKPLQLNAKNGYFTLAHHPNVGFNSVKPSSLYLQNAVDSPTQLVNGKAVSTSLTVGPEFKMPEGAALKPGAIVRIRSNEWVIEENKVASVNGNVISLAAASNYPLKAGWGYYFADQFWMLDSPGEWYWDEAEKMLYAWMPDSKSPPSEVRASTRAVDVDLSNAQYVTLDGLWIRTGGTGINARGSKGVVIRNARIEDVADIGIDASFSEALTATNNWVVRTGRDAIVAIAASNASIIGNNIRQSGVLWANNAAVSLPRPSFGAIVGGRTATITGNSISDASYSGIVVEAHSNVSGNTVSGACTVLDDGGGIYTYGGNNNSVISGNLVQNVRGNLDGKGVGAVTTSAQGIYLDEHASGVVVRGNTVVNADNGVQLHIAANNNIIENKLYGNRRSQIWLQENTSRIRPSGDLFGNSIIGNQIVPTSAAAVGISHFTSVLNTQSFGQYDSNIYFDRIYPHISVEQSPSGTVHYTFSAWKAATYLNGAPRLLDANGKAASSNRYATVVVAGSNIIPNGSLGANASGWTAWNQIAPLGTLSRVACSVGYCARYVAGASQGLLSSPNFSVSKNQWYRLTADVQGSSDGQIVNVTVRRGGGGNNGYEPLSKLYANVPVSRAWTRMSFTLQATASVNAADPITNDLGARVDFGAILPGQALSVANLELVPISMPASSTRTDILVNASSAASSMACPTAVSAPNLCNQYYRLSDNVAVAWPYTVPMRSSEIIYTLDPSLIDGDGDGIADSQDACPTTTAGVGVNARGCAIAQ